MRIMAVDYGDARTGFAVSDPEGKIAGEAWVLTEWDAERVAQAIAGEAQSRGAGCIVIGLPRNMDGSEGPRAAKSRALADMVRVQTQIPVELWDERLTTVDAHRILTDVGKHGKKRRQTVDAVAATLILEGFLGRA
jgi:putative Holliday junction resolvase